MLQNALKSKPKSSKSDVKVLDEDVKEKKPKSKISTKKDKPCKKVPQDTMTKFISNYGDTPHLQAIEDSYL